MPIEPGIYPDLSNKAYHADPALGSSMMAMLAKSPAHLRSYLDDPVRLTPAFMFGSPYHCDVLQPHMFSSAYRFWPKGYHRKKEEREEVDAKGQEWVKEVDLIDIDNMIAVLKNNLVACSLLSGGETEVSYFWQHPKYGFICKARPDYLRTRIHICLKSSKDASPEGFPNSIANFGYHKQAAHYRSGLAACDVSVNHSVLIAQEKKPPYAIGIYRLSEEDLYLGHEENKLIYQKYEEALSTDKWEGYSANIENISLPQSYIRNAKI